jgi:hypothetical protein
VANNKTKISPIQRFGDMSDEITGMTVICEYTFQLVYICNLCRSRILSGLLSVTPAQHQSLFVGYSNVVFQIDG